MRAKVIISICTVLATASIVAFARTSHEDPISIIAECNAMEGADHLTESSDTVFVSRGASVVGTALPDQTESANQTKVSIKELSTEDAYLLAKIAMAEAEGENTEGKALVMLVVLNRVQDDRFPNTIEDVIYQPRQFSPITSCRFDTVEPDEDCWTALQMIVFDKWDESEGALYFESKSDSTWHSENLDYLFQYGRHYFYKEKELEHD